MYEAIDLQDTGDLRYLRLQDHTMARLVEPVDQDSHYNKEWQAEFADAYGTKCSKTRRS